MRSTATDFKLPKKSSATGQKSKHGTTKLSISFQLNGSWVAGDFAIPLKITDSFRTV